MNFAIAAPLLLMLAPPIGDDEAAEVEAAQEQDHPEARLYDASIDASAAIDTAFERAQERGANVLIVMGANWCHDSRAFAGWSEGGQIGTLIEQRFELVFVNVGMPQTRDGHNLHIAERFDIGELEGTPTILIVSPSGEVLNRETAKSWRNAASRSEDEIFEELASFSLPRD